VTADQKANIAGITRNEVLIVVMLFD